MPDTRGYSVSQIDNTSTPNDPSLPPICGQEVTGPVWSEFVGIADGDSLTVQVSASTSFVGGLFTGPDAHYSDLTQLGCGTGTSFTIVLGGGSVSEGQKFWLCVGGESGNRGTATITFTEYEK